MAKPNAFSEMLSFKGRIRRMDWWLIGFGLGILQAVVGFGLAVILISPDSLGPSLMDHPIYLRIELGLAVVILWPMLAASVKRAHDRNATGWLPVVYFALNLTVTALQAAAPSAFATMGDTPPTATEWAMMAGALLIIPIGLWLLITLGFLDGTPGPNKYGPSPKGAGARNYQAPRID